MATNKMCKKPIIIDKNNQLTELKRIPLTEKTFNEEWIQDILAKNPEILPTGDIDDIYSPLLCIGREIEVPSGYIDNLYLSGHIVIVETKLWRNPEATRTVISQIIDYAKDICDWDYETIDSFYRKFHKDETLFDTMIKNHYQNTEDEAYFIDTVEKRIKNAKFLLMIVGDGIRERTEKITEFLDKKSSMPFDLALCELEIYEMENGSRLIIPQLTTKTRIIERSIFKITDSYAVQQNTISEHINNSQQNNQKLANKEVWAKNIISTSITTEQILEFINDMLELGFTYHVGTKDLCIDFPLANLNKKIGCLMLFGDGNTAAFQPSAYYDFLQKYDYSFIPAKQLFEELRLYLSQEQKNIPYERPNGYYFISTKTLINHKENILAIFERFKLNF